MAKARKFAHYGEALGYCIYCVVHAYRKPVKRGNHYVVTALECKGGRILDTEVVLCEDGAWRTEGK